MSTGTVLANILQQTNDSIRILGARDQSIETELTEIRLTQQEIRLQLQEIELKQKQAELKQQETDKKFAVLGRMGAQIYRSTKTEPKNPQNQYKAQPTKRYFGNGKQSESRVEDITPIVSNTPCTSNIPTAIADATFDFQTDFAQEEQIAGQVSNCGLISTELLEAIPIIATPSESVPEQNSETQNQMEKPKKRRNESEPDNETDSKEQKLEERNVCSMQSESIPQNPQTESEIIPQDIVMDYLKEIQTELKVKETTKLIRTITLAKWWNHLPLGHPFTTKSEFEKYILEHSVGIKIANGRKQKGHLYRFDKNLSVKQ